MLTPEGPKLLEFNARFGDPETQVVMPRMKSDAVEVFKAVAENRMGDIDLQWSDKCAVCVVLASEATPVPTKKGKVSRNRRGRSPRRRYGLSCGNGVQRR